MYRRNLPYPDLDEKHAEEIKVYLEKSDTRFFPEIILSVRTDCTPEYYGPSDTEQVGIVKRKLLLQYTYVYFENI